MLRAPELYLPSLIACDVIDLLLFVWTLLKASADSNEDMHILQGTYKLTEGAQVEVNDKNNRFYCLF